MSERRECDCPAPVPFPQEAKGHTCVRCRGEIIRDWVADDRTSNRFYDDLAAGIFPAGPDEDYQVFRAEAQGRDVSGRKKFGFRYLIRDNLVDAREEAADGANYALFHHLQQIRKGRGDTEDYALVLTMAKHFFLAHQAARALRRKDEGTP